MHRDGVASLGGRRTGDNDCQDRAENARVQPGAQPLRVDWRAKYDLRRGPWPGRLGCITDPATARRRCDRKAVVRGTLSTLFAVRALSGRAFELFGRARMRHAVAVIWRRMTVEPGAPTRRARICRGLPGSESLIKRHLTGRGRPAVSSQPQHERRTASHDHRNAWAPARPARRTISVLAKTAAVAVALAVAVASAASAQQPKKPAPKKPPAAPAQQQPAPPPAQQEQVQLIYSPWTKFCLKNKEPQPKQVCFTGKDARSNRACRWSPRC